MAIRIEYTITSGLLNITVELLQGLIVIDTNVHSSYGVYAFEDVPEGDYTIRFTGVDGCYGEEEINVCSTCPEGYIAYPDTCVLYNEQTPTYYSTTYTIVKKPANTSYGLYGTLIFDSYNYNGTGNYERFGFSPLNQYWANLPYPSLIGPMNRTSVWSSVTANLQDIGFSFCINIAVGKYYYVGFGCDNYGKIKLNGDWILEQDVTALTNMIVSNGDSYDGYPDRIPFRYWYIYSIYIPAGQNVIEAFGYNESSVAAVGIQIYDATKQDLMNATIANPLGDKILFSSEELEGQALHYEYSSTGGYHGYVCNEGYALNTCGETFLCVQRDEVPCPTTTTTTTV